MQCDSNGDCVLGAMSLMMNSSTTITTLPYHVSAYTHIQWCVEKHHNPQALQHSATYIWCWRVQGVGLAKASLPPADSVGGFM